MLEFVESLVESPLEPTEEFSNPDIGCKPIDGKMFGSEEKWFGSIVDYEETSLGGELTPPLDAVNANENLKNDLGWSQQVIDSIRSVDECEIYKDANLQEGVVLDRPCLQNPDINWEQTSREWTKEDGESLSRGELPFGFGLLDDLFSMTNKQRALSGLPPLDSNGKPYELHHVGQQMDSPLAELTMEQHRGAGNDVVLHEKTSPSQIDRSFFNAERSAYWKARAEML